MDDGEDSHDEEYYIEQAKKLSMADGGPNDTPDVAGDQPAAEEPQLDVKDVIETDFMKGLVADLELDIDDADMGDIVANSEENKKAEEEKKEEEKKDGGSGGGAAGNQ